MARGATGAALVAGDAAARRAGGAEELRRQGRRSWRPTSARSGERALLNFGHTFGHALEAETGFGDALLHGEAVALGMRLAFDLSVAARPLPAGGGGARAPPFRGGRAAGRARPRSPRRRAFAPDALLRHMRRDKKVRDGRITLILARDIGEAFISRDVPAAISCATSSRPRRANPLARRQPPAKQSASQPPGLAHAALPARRRASPSIPAHIECRGFRRADGLWDIEGHLTDTKTYDFDTQFRGTVASGAPVHEMWLRLTVDDDLVIRESRR